jgi:hypothetical protein
MEHAQQNAAWPPEGTAPQNAVRWGETRAARPVSVPPGTPAAPLHRPPQPTNRRPAVATPAERTRQTTIAQIEEYFPGVHCWWGLHTCLWWAYVPTPQGGRLLEAATPNALIAQLTQIVQRSQERSWIVNQ